MDPVSIIDKKEWSSIDIFVFSNGQKYSPPRKYHLRSEELQWWGTLLSHLGRTQYGSGHSSIELYTINGCKITGPLELINGAAYVAVKPPDIFSDTGYEQYLLKASRSWEKRLSQKINNPTISKIENKDLKLSGDHDETSIGILKTAMDESVLSVISKDMTTSSMKTQNSITQKIPQRQSNTSTKHIQKKRLSVQKETLQKTCANTDNVFSCPRKTSFKKNNYTNRKELSISSSINPYNNSLNEQSTCCNKPNRRKPVNINGNNSLKPHKIGTENLPYQSMPYNNELNKNNKAEKQKHENETDSLSADEQPIISLFKNNDIDLLSNTTDQENVALIDKDHTNTKDNIFVEIENNKDEKRTKERKVIDKDINKQIDKDEKEQNNYSTPKDFIEYKDTNTNEQFEFSETEYTRSNELKKDYANNTYSNHISDTYIAYMNKGNVLLLKFHIKVKDCKTIFNKDNNNKTAESEALNNLLETEKKSQVNIDINLSGELLNPNFERNSDDDKILESTLNKLYNKNINEEDDHKQKIIIIQCACQKAVNVCECRGNEAKYKLFENENPYRKFTSCECDRILKITNENPQADDINYSNNKDLILIPKTNENHVKTLAEKFEGLDKIISNERHSVSLYSNNKSKLNESCSKCAKDSKSNDSPRSQQQELPTILKDSKMEITGEQNDKTSSNSCHKATQTDWSEVLIEARRQEDDTYTFHLPSLYVLKQCKL